ncbi:MAG: TonB family protein [Vicinamibacterales bacterium]
MVVFGTMLLVTLTAVQVGSSTSAECLSPSPNAATTELCLAEQSVKRADSFPSGSAERTRELQNAAVRYRRASDLGTSDLRLRVLIALAQLYDAPRLNEPGQREGVLRELIALVPTDPRFAFDLATLHEGQGFTDAAEETLLNTRQRHPTQIEAYKRLAQFYARRVTALDTAVREQAPTELPNPGQPDRDGVYQVGANLPAPPREGVPVYPGEAQAAGIQGGVQAEIVIDHEGIVTDARIVKSIPLLDDAALKAVRGWRFEPTIVDGRAVPVRMVVTVSFTLSK